MDVRDFIRAIETTYGRELKDMQRLSFIEKLDVIPDDLWIRIEKEVTRTCKHLPSIAEIFTAAQECGWRERTSEFRPHAWKPTDCRLCDGSGLLAAFWSQEFSKPEVGPETQCLRLHYVMPYHSSGEYGSRKDHDDIRAVYRCSCSAGQVDTLPRGVPIWRQDMPQVIERNWSRAAV